MQPTAWTGRKCWRLLVSLSFVAPLCHQAFRRGGAHPPPPRKTSESLTGDRRRQCFGDRRAVVLPVLSTSGAASASGASGEAEDLLIFTASRLGSATAGSFALRFDGSDVGLSANDEDLDAACDTAAGSLLLSTLGSFNVTGASGADEDVLQFNPGSLGPSTTGSYRIFLDTSSESIATSADVSAVEIKE